MVGQAEAIEQLPEARTTSISYLYFMADAPDRVRSVAAEHAKYWQTRGLSGYLGGPFADRSGGLITFDAIPDEQAREVVASDPFVRAGLIQTSWIKRWVIETPIQRGT